MQEAGRSNNSIDKVLSIQFQLDGLSFFSHLHKRYSFQPMIDGMDIRAVISKECAAEGYEVIYLYHNSLEYVMIPKMLYDSGMNESYLQAKGIALGDGREIYVAIIKDIVYLSVLESCSVPQGVDGLIVAPLIAKLVAANSCLQIKTQLSYVIVDSVIHIVRTKAGVMNLCESLPIVSPSDVLFFIRTAMQGESSKRLPLVSLYEVGEFALTDGNRKGERIEKMVTEQYLDIV